MLTVWQRYPSRDCSLLDLEVCQEDKDRFVVRDTTSRRFQEVRRASRSTECLDIGILIAYLSP
jgi:hypothetical protein